MKKVITLCLFAFTMLIGTQSTLAQNKVKINEKASLQAKELRAQLKFDENAMEQVYLAYQAHEKKMYSINDYLTEGSADYNDAKNKATQALQSRIKDALGMEIFERYLMITNQQNIIEASPETKSK